MTDAEADLAQESAKAQDKPRPTVQHLAQAVANLTERLDTFGQVNESLASKLDKVQKGQVAAAQLINGLKQQPGDLVKPPKLDGVLARLETLERAGRTGITDFQPAIDALHTKLKELKAGIDETVPELATEGALTELREQVAALAELVNTPAGQDTVGSSAHQALTEWTENQVNALGVQVNELGVNLSRRLEALEENLRGVGQTVTSAAFADKPRGVQAKMLALMDEVTAIGKNRDAKGKGVSFKFRGVEDAQNAVGAAQRKVRILILPEVVDWQYGQEQVTGWDGNNQREKTVTWSTSRLTMRYTFVDPDDGSQMSVTMVGEGKDNSDKSASKAASMACKYALFQALMIPFEDVDESDEHNDARAEDYRPLNTPGARVNRGEMSAAQAAQEYHEQGRQERREEQRQAQEMTPLQKAATLVEWVKKGMAQPVEQALKTVQTAMERSTAAGLNDLEVEGIPVRVFLTTSLQSVSTALNERAASAGAQGMTRQEQQTGQGTRAAAAPQHPVRNPTVADMEDALQLLDRGGVPPEVLDAAQQTVNNFEATQ